jgi:hypothetical protein
MAGIQSRQAQDLIEPRANDDLFYPVYRRELLLRKFRVFQQERFHIG